MSIATTLGSFTGSSAAHAKHVVLASGVHSHNFFDAYVDSTKAAYIAKDSELGARRAALNAARSAAPLPAMKRPAKLAVSK